MSSLLTLVTAWFSLWTVRLQKQSDARRAQKQAEAEQRLDRLRAAPYCAWRERNRVAQ